MLQIIGIITLFAMVFGGYVLSGGHFEVILHALPHEMMTIGGAAVAALLLGGSIGSVKRTVFEIAKAFSGPKWKTSDYRDLLCLLFLLTKTMKMKGMIALEAHIEKPLEVGDLQALSENLEGSFRAGFHLRHAAHDDDEPRRPAPGRDGDGEAP